MSNLTGAATLSMTGAGTLTPPTGRIVTTPGSTSANSYIDEQTATLLLTRERLNVAAWHALSFDQRESALIWATTLLDQYFDWQGYRADQTQALRFPRNGAYDLDDWVLDETNIPDVLQRATAELAFELARKDRLKEPSLFGVGLSEAKVGPLAVKVDEKTGRLPQLIPDYIVTMLRSIGSLTGLAHVGSGRSVRLRRG
ncbi:MAG: hypothetical protein RL885_25060 [Planctomycetota bacterium]